MVLAYQLMRLRNSSTADLLVAEAQHVVEVLADHLALFVDRRLAAG